MSIGTTIANMFRPVQQVAMTPQPTVPPANPLAMNNPGAQAQVPPAGGSNPTVAQPEPANPMDAFAAMWQNDPKSAPQADPLHQPLFKPDPAALAAAAAKVDFVSQLPQELVAQAMAGNDPQAFLQVINAVGQRALATAAQLSTATVEQAAQRNNARIEQVLPDRMRSIQLAQMPADNPALNHPASQPLLSLVRSQIQMKNPSLSAAEINKQAESYLVTYASAISAPTPEQQATQQAAAGGTDWENWAGLNGQ
jgi:hypothetical protein